MSVSKIVKKQRKRNPAPPFITSTLQQEAVRKIGFTAQKTMRIAQQLYEGIEIGEGAVDGLRDEAVGGLRFRAGAHVCDAIADALAVFVLLFGAAHQHERRGLSDVVVKRGDFEAEMVGELRGAGLGTKVATEEIA